MQRAIRAQQRDQREHGLEANRSGRPLEVEVCERRVRRCGREQCDQLGASDAIAAALAAEKQALE